MKWNRITGQKSVVTLAIIICIVSAGINYFTNHYFISRLSGTGALNIFLLSTVFGNNIFTYTMPLIGSLAYTYKLYLEISNGYSYNKIISSSHFKYFGGHYVNAFRNGASVAAIGMVTWLVISIMIDRSAAYRIIDVIPGNAFSEIYDNSMVLYAVCVVCNSIIFCALYSALSTGIYMASRNIALSIIAPTLFYVLSTLSFGGYSLFGEYVLPFSTVAFQNITLVQLVKDHTIVFCLATTLYVFGVKKWQTTAS